MKKRNALALALAAGLVLGGANTAHAEGWEGESYEDQWAQASAEQDEKLAKEKELAEAKEAAKAQLKEAGITSDFYFNLVDGAKTKEGLDALVAETIESHKASNPEVTPEEPKDTEEESGEWNGYEDDYQRKWEEASKEQDEKLAKEKELAAAKEAAIAAIKEAGVTSDYYVNLINKGKTVEGVNALRDQIIKAHEDSKEEEGPKVTIDEWLLKEAKKEAIEELKKAGITGQIYFDQINKAKTVEGVEALKSEILKAHKGSEEKPGKDDKKPGKEDDKKVVIPGYKIEDIAKPSKKDKEDGTYKPGYATREEAEKAAKEALKNNKTKDSYTIFEDADGRFGYYLWSKADEEEAEKAAKIKEASKANEKANQKASTPAAKSSNPNAAPKTGVAGISAVAGLAAVSVAGILATRKKED